MTKPTLYYFGQRADGFGWGLCNTNLSNALTEHFNVIFPEPHKRKFDAPVFMPIPDHSLRMSPKVKAPSVFGYCFAEWPLSDEAKRNARAFAHIFTGSTWNTQRLSDAEIDHCSTLVQGVDFDLFKPEAWQDHKQFRVFSGGKFEFRKGQDYVIAAMKHFMAEHNDAVLLTSWHNPWQPSARTMEKSWLIDDWTKPLTGLDPTRVITLPPLRNRDLPAAYGQTHVGVFPNRCEAGTNLVMMEYMACSRPVIATYATGHKDVLDGDGPWKLTTGDEDYAGWFNTNVSDIICALEKAYAEWKAGTLPERGAKCRYLIEPWTWGRAASSVATQVQRFL